MDTDHYLELIYKEIEGTLTDAEKAELAAWEAADARNHELADDVREAWKVSDNLAAAPAADLDIAFGELQEKMEADLLTEADKVVSPDARPTFSPAPSRRWMGIAAGIALIMAVGAALFFLRQDPGDPGVQTAVIMTGDSVKVLQLPDGTTVYLNRNSRLTHFRELTGRTREVSLEGEAFFEVTPNPEKPFLVNTPLLNIKVVGTSFNVKCPRGAAEAGVQVAEGIVRVSNIGGNDSVEVSANQMIQYSQGRPLFVELVRENPWAWKTRKLVFRDTPVKDMIRELEDFYQVTLETESSALGDCPFSAIFDDAPLQEVWETMEAVLDVTIEETESGKYVIRGGGC